MNSIKNQPSFGAIVRIQGARHDLNKIKDAFPNDDYEFVNATKGSASPIVGRIYDVYVATGDDAEKLTEFKTDNGLMTQDLGSTSFDTGMKFSEMFKNVVNCGQNMQKAIETLTSQE